MNVIIQILLILFVVLWTARLARNKGRNVLVWAALAAVPAVGLIEGIEDGITALCMFPMLALIFIPSRRPVADADQQDTTVTCPRCQHTHEPGPIFCTNCGWELTKPYATADLASEPGEEPNATTREGSAAPTGVGDIPGDAPSRAADTTLSPPVVEPMLASTQGDAAVADAASPTAPGVDVSEPEPAFVAEPLTISRSLTAAGMTERGLALVNQGRVREAVDQFTKAIALDPRYREAWANRAQAYSQLGLNDKAASDQRQLEAI
jgi:hypothetical protein